MEIPEIVNGVEIRRLEFLWRLDWELLPVVMFP